MRTIQVARYRSLRDVAHVGGLCCGKPFLGTILGPGSRALGVSVAIVQPGAVATPIFGTLRNTSIAAAVAAGPGASAGVRHYPHLYTAADVENEALLEARAADTRCTSEAIEHAVAAPRPRTRYLVANIVGAPAWLLAGLMRALPDRLADALLSAQQPR